MFQNNINFYNQIAIHGQKADSGKLLTLSNLAHPVITSHPYRAGPPFRAKAFVSAGSRQQTLASVSARRRFLTAVDEGGAKSTV